MELIIFTDGSHTKKNNQAGYGVYFPNKELADISEKFTLKPITHQRAELYAIYKALVKATRMKVKSIMIYSDSEYSIKSVTLWINNWKKNGWKTTAGQPVKNLDIIKPIDEMITSFKGTIKFQHVSAHTKGTDKLSICNDVADALAKRGAQKN
jgi:ribonuclease HI